MKGPQADRPCVRVRFPSLNYAQRRLTTLTELRLVERFRPFRLAGGSYPYHYALASATDAKAAPLRASTPTSSTPPSPKPWSTSRRHRRDTEAIANEYQLRTANKPDRDSLTRQIGMTQAAIDRYLTAFENGTLDESVCGRRINELQTQLDQLTARQTELGEPEEVHRPDTAAIERIRPSLSDILPSGTLGRRKAVMETHIAEIRLVDDRLIPSTGSHRTRFAHKVRLWARTNKMRNLF